MKTKDYIYLKILKNLQLLLKDIGMVLDQVHFIIECEPYLKNLIDIIMV